MAALGTHTQHAIPGEAVKSNGRRTRQRGRDGQSKEKTSEKGKGPQADTAQKRPTEAQSTSETVARQQPSHGGKENGYASSNESKPIPRNRAAGAAEIVSNEAPNEYLTLLNKKLRSWRKKLAKVEQIEQKISSGGEINDQQQVLLKNKQNIARVTREYEELRTQMEKIQQSEPKKSTAQDTTHLRVLLDVLSLASNPTPQAPAVLTQFSRQIFAVSSEERVALVVKFLQLSEETALEGTTYKSLHELATNLAVMPPAPAAPPSVEPAVATPEAEERAAPAGRSRRRGRRGGRRRYAESVALEGPREAEMKPEGTPAPTEVPPTAAPAAVAEAKPESAAPKRRRRRGGAGRRKRANAAKESAVVASGAEGPNAAPAASGTSELKPPRARHRRPRGLRGGRKAASQMPAAPPLSS